MTKYTIITSPLGKLTLAADDNNLVALHIEGDRYFTKIPSDWEHDPAEPILVETAKQLGEYFAGTRKNFDITIRLQGTPFQQSVWGALQKIVRGQMIVYQDIAYAIGKPNAVRAVGTAVGKNPVCIIVPCHRVVATNGTLGGYVAGLERKHELLRLEKAI